MCIVLWRGRHHPSSGTRRRFYWRPFVTHLSLILRSSNRTLFGERKGLRIDKFQSEPEETSSHISSKRLSAISSVDHFSSVHFTSTPWDIRSCIQVPFATLLPARNLLPLCFVPNSPPTSHPNPIALPSGFPFASHPLPPLLRFRFANNPNFA